MSQSISAAAISRILNTAGFRKASNGTHWSPGFSVVGYGPFAKVDYTDVDTEAAVAELTKMKDLINERYPKYEATLLNDDYGWVVSVSIRPEEAPEPVVEAAPAAEVEKLAEESPYGVTVQEVRQVLLTSGEKIGRFFEYTNQESDGVRPGNQGAGFFVERLEGARSRLVRVSYRDHSHTSYALVLGGREKCARDTVEMYAKRLQAEGFSTWIDYEDTDGWSVLVGTEGEFVEQDSPEAIKAALLELREAVEDEAMSYITRKAGDHSVFIYYLVPFKDKLRRMEVFWTGGEYKSKGRFGQGDFFRMKGADEVVKLAKAELAD